MTVMDTKQLPFGWSTSEAKANSAAICLGQTSFEDMMFDLGLNDMMRCNRSQQDHKGPEENHHPASTLFDLSGTSTRRVNSDNRHVCTICFKSHTRPSRAMACENEHLGYQPFVCDGTCGEPGW
ncbi:hypothetical protein FRC19_011991 [Serendipita sp. 401]|nr:hypothetical protein FRC19_011991 [Serendipita sp. 401]